MTKCDGRRNGDVRWMFYLFFLNVSVESLKNYVKAVKWLQNGRVVTASGKNNGKFQTFDSILRVNNVQTDDTGVYQCFVTLDSGRQVQSSGELRLGGTFIFTLFVSFFNLRIFLKNPVKFSVCRYQNINKNSGADWSVRHLRGKTIIKKKIEIEIEKLDIFSCFSDILPTLSYSFIDQTVQPGPLVSLKCSASGNPTPRISWTLDGYDLPQKDRYFLLFWARTP